MRGLLHLLVALALVAPVPAAGQSSPGPATVPTDPGTPGAPPDRRRPEVRAIGAGCIRAGDTIVVTGRGFGPRPRGRIEIETDAGLRPLVVRAWSDVLLRLDQPPGLDLRPGRAYELTWIDGRTRIAALGRVTTCAGATQPAVDPGVEVYRTPDGQPEYVVSTPEAAAPAAAAALTALGATVVRTRDLAALGETITIVTLPPGVTLEDARAALGQAVPGAEIDLHHIYGFVAGPRLYAAAQVTGSGQGCALTAPLAIGVVDGPVDAAHPALARTPPVRRAFLPRREDPAPADHGTAVAALIAGDLGAGPLAGFASGAQILAAEVFWAGRTGPSSAVEWLAAGLDWQLGTGVRLVNFSFAGPPNRSLGRLVAIAARRGAIMIAAAGNDAAPYVAFPAAAPEVIAVTAIDAARDLYDRANRGPEIEFAAPGVEVWAARAGGDGLYATGTSFAAPIVTAVAAHHLAARQNLAADVIRALMRDAVEDLGPEGRDAQFGWGLVRLPDC